MVFRHIRWLVAGQARLQIEQISAGPFRVEDPSHHAVRSAPSVHDANRLGVDVDLHTEVGAALANGPAQRLEGQLCVLLGVAHDDVVAASADQLVQPEIVEVAAIAQVDESAAPRGLAEQLGDQIRPRKDRARIPAGTAPARIAQPPSEPGIKHGQQERHRSRGVVSHVRVRRRPRDRHRRPHLRTIRMAVAQGGNIPARLELAPLLLDQLQISP